MRTLATLVFILAAAAAGAYLAQRKTVVDGKVMAADLMGQLKGRGLESIDCDDRIPIGPGGAAFRCEVRGEDGSTATIQYTMNREGGLAGKVLDSAGPVRPRPRTSGDPWGN